MLRDSEPELLQANQSELIQIMGGRASKIQTLHLDFRENLTRRIESATATLEEQNHKGQRISANDQGQTRTEVLGAVAEAALVRSLSV